jgi:hypothetical protein
MSANAWLAIDVGTAPAVRARELRFAWERFVSAVTRRDGTDDDDDDPDVVREAIGDSWRRSLAAGVDPRRHQAPVVEDEGTLMTRWETHPLARAAPLIRDCLSTTAVESGYLVVITDADGVLLSIEGSGRTRMRAAESINFAEGTLWSEPGAGTNAIGTALAVDHAVQVFGPEHFNETVQRWTCSAAPIHDPDTGEPIGVIDLTGDVSTVHPASLAGAMATARAVETSLVLQLQERDTRLRARYGERLSVAAGSSVLVSPTGRPITRLPEGWGVVGRLAIPPGGGAVALPSGASAIAEPVDRAGEVYLVRAPRRLATQPAPAPPSIRLAVLGRDRAVLEVGGRRIELRRRLAEILVLLSDHHEGLSAESLCAYLYGDGGSPSSVRVEVSRLRKVLGPGALETDRYRLTCALESDARRVENLLRRGLVREAAEGYTGPLLPESEAPGVVEERERLESWLHQAVMTAGDVEALWAWVLTAHGTEDLRAWKRLLSLLEFTDPRRALAAARVGELRRGLA